MVLAQKGNALTAEDAERRTDSLPTKSAVCGKCAEAPPPAPDGDANAVSAAQRKNVTKSGNGIL